MTGLQKLLLTVAGNNCENSMVKNVIGGGGTQNLLDKREKRIDKR